MTVSTTANSVTWIGNGATSTFTYSFYIPTTASYSVVQTDTSGNQTTLGASAFTITGIGTVGGTVTLNSGALTTGYRLTLTRSVPFTQPTSLSNQGGLWPSVVEQAIDNVALQVQELAQQVNDAIIFNPADTTLPTPLPIASVRAGNVLAFDQYGQVTVVSLSAAVSAGTTFPSAVSTALAQNPTGSGALVLATGATLVNPVVGTQSGSDNSTKAASTAYVTSAVSAGVASAVSTAEAASVPVAANPNTGWFKSLVITVTSSTALTVAADLVAMTNASGATIAKALSATLGTGSAGLNGLDTGSVAASTWYAVFAVSNGTTTGAVLSTSGSAPNASITATYPYYSRIGWVRTNGSSNLIGTIQKGRSAQYVVGGANVGNLPIIASGTAGSTSTPTWVSVSLTGVVPTTAAKLDFAVSYNGASSQVFIIAPNNSYGAYVSTSNPPPISFGNASTTYGIQATMSASLELESSAIFWANSSANTIIAVKGWEDNL